MRCLVNNNPLYFLHVSLFADIRRRVSRSLARASVLCRPSFWPRSFASTTKAVVMAFAVAVACSGAASASILYSFYRSALTPSSIFEYPELTKALRKRKAEERDLQMLYDTLTSRVAALRSELFSAPIGSGIAVPKRTAQEAKKEYRARMAQLQDWFSEEQSRITFKSSGGKEREECMQKYGCAKWTDKALETLTSLSPIVEVGAGAGHWQAQLSARGADVVAFDNESSPISFGPKVGEVNRGDENEILKVGNDRTLFLCYPPPGSFAARALKLYRGNCLVYVGEGKGGVNADRVFFQELEDSRRWKLREVQKLDPFPGNYERFYVFEKRRQE